MSDGPNVERPVWNRYYTPIRLSESVVHVQAGPVSGATVTIREPDVDGSLVELIDGETTSAEIVASYPDEQRAVTILSELAEKKVVLEGSREGVDFAATPISPLRVSQLGTGGDAVDARALVAQRGPVGERFYRYLREAGITDVDVAVSGEGEASSVPEFATVRDRETPPLDSYDYAVYLSDAGFDERARTFNRELVRAGVPGTFAVRDGFDVFVGPTVFPGETGCLECFLERLAVNSRQTDRLKAAVGTEPVTNDSAHAALRFDLATNLVAMEFATLVRHDQNVTTGRFVHLNTMNLAVSADGVLRHPDCPVCSSGGDGTATRIRLTERITGGEGAR